MNHSFPEQQEEGEADHYVVSHSSRPQQFANNNSNNSRTMTRNQAPYAAGASEESPGYFATTKELEESEEPSPLHQRQQRQASIATSAISSSSNSQTVETTTASIHNNNNNSNININSNNPLLFPRHSDFTVPTGNLRNEVPSAAQHHQHQPLPQQRASSPPLGLVVAGDSNRHMASHVAPTLEATPLVLHNDNNNNNNSEDDDLVPPRRNIFGVAVEQKYQTTTDFSRLHPNQPVPVTTITTITTTSTSSNLNLALLNSDFSAPPPPPPQSQSSQSYPEEPRRFSYASSIDVDRHSLAASTPSASPKSFSHPLAAPTTKLRRSSKEHNHHHHHQKRAYPAPHETIHAQSLLLGLAFCAVWSPSNLMAPNLTEMAAYFEFDNLQRDLYLGSYCALATGVVSFPIGASIGVLADMVNRKYLFCATLAGGALSAWATGQAQTYWQLFLARLVNGGFMAGSVPVAFSFLGDLFAVQERNAASSGLTAMMGLGIIMGQVYAGTVGPELGWQHAFGVSAGVTLFFALVCLALVQEPERGGKEAVLQDMLKAGTRYERKLSWQGFWHACLKNASNSILLWQGFFSSLPWGIIFVFLNDYLSQERGFSVPAATYLVFLFGMGCAVGGVLGGSAGQVAQSMNRRYLPLFMAVTTELGILPFLGMLNVRIPRAHGTLGILFAFGSGLIASLPSVNVRPCLINVNPPETRGAALTAANLLIQLGRGIGPSCVTLLGTFGGINRQHALNWTLTVFWTISALQLVFLSKTLPKDQDRMEEELAKYAASVIEQATRRNGDKAEDRDRIDEENASTPMLPEYGPLLTDLVDDPGLAQQHRTSSSISNRTLEESVEVSIQDRMTSFDGVAVNQTLVYVREGFKEFKEEFVGVMQCGACGDIVESSSEDNSSIEGEGGQEEKQDESKRGRGRQVSWSGQEETGYGSTRHAGEDQEHPSQLYLTSTLEPEDLPNEKTGLLT